MVKPTVMLHFFRKIRRDLLAKNKTIRYLKYGIGEIILVVIGILIAIQVDNWNEDRIAAENNKLLFQDVSRELVDNIKDLERVFNNHLSSDSLYYKVLKRKVEYEDYKKAPIYFYNLHEFATWDLVDDDYKKLLNRKDKLSESQKSLLSELKLLHDELKDNVDFYDKRVVETHFDIRRLLKDQTGFSNLYFGILKDEFIQYCLSERYLNYVTEHRFIRENQLRSIVRFRSEALKVYEKIAETFEMEIDPSVAKDFKDIEHIKGVYNIPSDNGDRLLFIRGENELHSMTDLNETFLMQFDVYPFSNSHLILSGQDFYQQYFMTIEYGNDAQVLGLTNVTHIETDADGNRLMWKKIE